MYTTKPIKKINNHDFKKLLQEKEILISYHALDHLSQGQRKVFKEEELIHILKKEVPRRTYLQQNGRFAVYYRKKDGYRKIIIKIEKQKAKIITFMNNSELPKK
jgi:ribosome biogenesis protein Nip4